MRSDSTQETAQAGKESTQTEAICSSRADLRTAAVAAFAVACSICAASVLHGVAARPEAARVVPVLWLWGLGVTWAVRAPPRSIALLLACAVAVRAPLVGVPPLLSDDLFRYLWEGMVSAGGINPLLHSPASLDGLNDALQARVNHAEIASVYPPLALWWFRLLWGAGGSPAAAQAWTALADVALVGGLYTVLVGRGGPTWPAWLYALHPLPAVEAGAGAHIDVLAAALAVWAIAAHDRGRPILAVLTGGAAAAAKLVPLLLAAPLLRAAGPRRAAIASVGAALGIGILAWPILSGGPALAEGLGAYAAHWSFNGLLFGWLHPVLGEATRPLLVGCGGGVVVAAWLRLRDPVDVWAAVGSAFVLLSPTVHPWYVLWALVPSVLSARRGWSLAATALLGSYAVLATLDPATGVWHEGRWLWALTWPAALAGLGLELAQARSDDRPTQP